jgi:hypothetical protein
VWFLFYFHSHVNHGVKHYANGEVAPKMNKSNNTGNEKWLTLKEAGEITGKNVQAIRMLIKRNKFVNVKKTQIKGHDNWLIRRDELNLLASQLSSHVKDNVNDSHVRLTDIPPVNMISVEYYDKKRNEWDRDRDNLLQGIMMYRYKFEELDQRVKLLPAPVEAVASKIGELEARVNSHKEAEEQKAHALAQAQEIIEQATEAQKRYIESLTQLKTKLQEEEHAKEAFRLQWEQAMIEAKKPWWQKLWRKQ